MPLPPFTSMPVPPNGTMVPKVIVIHRAENALGDGLGLARYNYNNPGKYRWNWSVGGGGQAYKHLPFTEEGIHAAGLNSFAVGIEQDGFSASSPWPEAQLRTTAAIVAEFCRFIGKAPSRDFIIGHVEDNTTTRDEYPGTFTAWGGSSTHTDPGAGFPWRIFMGYVQEAYGDDKEDGMSKEYEDAQVNRAIGQANGYGLVEMKAAGYKGAALPASAAALAADPEKHGGFWYALGKLEVGP